MVNTIIRHQWLRRTARWNKKIPADEFLSDSFKEEALNPTVNYSDCCLFDISDKATLLRIVEHYKLDTKQFKNPAKKLEELRQALIEKVPDTNQRYHLHGHVIWPTVAIPAKYSRNSAKAEKTKREINNPATGAKSKVKIFDIQTLTYYQLIWLHVQFKIPLQRKDLENRGSLIRNLECHSRELEMVQ